MTLASLSDYLDLNKLLGILPNHSEHGKEIDHMLNVCHWFMLILFIGWGVFFLYTIYRFHRSRNPKADYHGIRSHFSTHLEAGVVIVEAVILLGFAIPLWGKRVNEIPLDEKATALKIRAIGYQFGWYYHYAGADGVFGSQHTRFIQGANVIGLDPNDPKGTDDAIVMDQNMHLINNKATVVRVTSRDVIHGFALHQMRVQQDAIPGTEANMWFRPITTGSWQVICAQLCGSGHTNMAGKYTVVEKAEWDEWFKLQQETTQKNLSIQREDMKKKATAAVDAAPAVH